MALHQMQRKVLPSLISSQRNLNNFIQIKKVEYQSGEYIIIMSRVMLYVAIYNNEKLKITPQQMRQIFTAQRFHYKSIQFFLHRWDYRVQMDFVNKPSRSFAIDEVKKLKNEYNISYRYELGHIPRATYHLNSYKQYVRLINHSRHNRQHSVKIQANQVKKQYKPQVKYESTQQQIQYRHQWKKLQSMIPEPQQIVKQQQQTKQERRKQQVNKIMQDKKLLRRLLEWELNRINSEP